MAKAIKLIRAGKEVDHEGGSARSTRLERRHRLGRLRDLKYWPGKDRHAETVTFKG
jgi:hypothetical protein